MKIVLMITIIVGKDLGWMIFSLVLNECVYSYGESMRTPMLNKLLILLLIFIIFYRRIANVQGLTKKRNELFLLTNGKTSNIQWVSLSSVLSIRHKNDAILNPVDFAHSLQWTIKVSVVTMTKLFMCINDDWAWIVAYT